MGITGTFFSSRTDREAVGLLAMRLWNAVASGFRPDEQSVEGQRFLERAADLRLELDSLPGGEVPDLALTKRMLAVLLPVLTERIEDLHHRIDDLDASCRTRSRELTILQLAGSWQTDELERCRTLLVEQLRSHNVPMPANGADGAAPLVSQLLAALLHVTPPPARKPMTKVFARRNTDPFIDAGPLAMLMAEQQAPPMAEEDTDQKSIARALRDVLDGSSQSPRLARALDDDDLARRLTNLAAEHRSYRAILQRIGVLPKDG